jgi:hypothetical protein
MHASYDRPFVHALVLDRPSSEIALVVPPGS